MLLSKGEMEWEAKQGAPNFVRLLSEFGRHKRLVYLLSPWSVTHLGAQRAKKKATKWPFFSRVFYDLEKHLSHLVHLKGF